jgi:predicted phosphohydrolase
MQNTDENVDYDKIVNRESIRLNMSLDEAEKLSRATSKPIFAFLHFPPVWSEFVCRPIIDVLKSHDIKHCYFGHVHGSYSCPDSFTYDNIRFHMISADFLDFQPRIV